MDDIADYELAQRRADFNSNQYRNFTCRIDVKFLSKVAGMESGVEGTVSGPVRQPSFRN
jgi:hypothetical protein